MDLVKRRWRGSTPKSGQMTATRRFRRASSPIMFCRRSPTPVILKYGESSGVTKTYPVDSIYRRSCLLLVNLNQVTQWPACVSYCISRGSAGIFYHSPNCVHHILHLSHLEPRIDRQAKSATANGLGHRQVTLPASVSLSK